MLALHTSDWHLGRALHGHRLGDAQAAFVDHLVSVVRAESVDVVLVSGDVHDRALPPVEAMKLFDEALGRLRDAGAAIVVISGNHDAPARLGDKSGLLDPRVTIRTDPARVAEPVIIEDEHGPVAIYAIPYLEPAAVRDLLPADDGSDEGRGLGSTDPEPSDPASTNSRTADPETTKPQSAGQERADQDGVRVASHAAVLGRAMTAVTADRGRRGGRSIVLAHAWVTGGAASESEREIGGLGGVGNVPAGLFDGVTYTALGHLHRPQSIGRSLRYSGSPLPYSFSEADDTKSSWLVELDATGLGWVEAIPVPVYRRLSAVRGRLDDLMTNERYATNEADFVAVTLTDAERPADAMTAVQRRFPHALRLYFAPDPPDRHPTTTLRPCTLETGSNCAHEGHQVCLTQS
ncbi:MAG: exonuclease SbcCD subunit D [Frankia sp.]